MHGSTFLKACGLAIAAGAFGLTVPAHAGTKYQTSLVPNMSGSSPGFSAAGSTIKIDGHGKLKGKIKKVVDGAGVRVSTDGVESGDDYVIEIEFGFPGNLGRLLGLPFELNNGNGNFSADLREYLSGPGAPGDGISINAIRVKDSTGTVIGVGGVAIE